MFYLLEDNRIIETEKEYEHEYIKDPYLNSQNEYKFVYVKDLYYKGLQVLRNLTTEENIGFIKKQSENVWDFAEVGDLVGDYDYFRGIVTKIDKLDNEAIYLQVNQEYYHRSEDFTKFYKRNKKGDYIKVWEKKNV